MVDFEGIPGAVNIGENHGKGDGREERGGGGGRRGGRGLRGVSGVVMVVVVLGLVRNCFGGWRVHLEGVDARGVVRRR